MAIHILDCFFKGVECSLRPVKLCSLYSSNHAQVELIFLFFNLPEQPSGHITKLNEWFIESSP